MTSAQAAGIAARVADVQSRIAGACVRVGRDPAGVTLVAVSKGHGAAAMAAAFEAGVQDFGENYLQEAISKLAEFRRLTCDPPAVRFHFVGHLQTNKARAAAGAFAILHGVDSARLIEAIAAAHIPVKVMLQVNLGGEASKHGVTPGGLADLVAAARVSRHMQLAGLMTIPPPVGEPEESRPHFRRLAELARSHGLPWLSMGMTDDFEVAIEEGATHVRIGRAIFGERLP
jgi:pyridoxal phosphate enzyme (YggS family)